MNAMTHTRQPITGDDNTTFTRLFHANYCLSCSKSRIVLLMFINKTEKKNVHKNMTFEIKKYHGKKKSSKFPFINGNELYIIRLVIYLLEKQVSYESQV